MAALEQKGAERLRKGRTPVPVPCLFRARSAEPVSPARCVRTTAKETRGAGEEPAGVLPGTGGAHSLSCGLTREDKRVAQSHDGSWHSSGQ